MLLQSKLKETNQEQLMVRIRQQPKVKTGVIMIRNNEISRSVEKANNGNLP